MNLCSKTSTVSVACGCLFVVVGCSQVDSVHPLSDKQTQASDDRLLGTWTIVDPNAAQTASKNVAIENDPAPTLTIEKVGAEYFTARVEEQQKLALLPTKIGDELYMSVRAAKPNGAEISHLLTRYQWVNEEECHLYFIDPSRAGKAIAAKQIAGVVTYQANQKTRPQPEVQLARFTASTATLREYFATPDGVALFLSPKPGLILRKNEK